MTINTGNSYLDSLANPASSAAAKKSGQTIDQGGFLKLLTAQLKTQDPTEPTDSTQMVQQMATFSQVAGIAEMNQSLKTITSDLAASRFDASGWIGRAALLAGNVAGQAANGAYAGQITLPSDTKDVTLSLVNASGQTVYSKDLGANVGGDISWSWDGKDTAGNPTTDGALQVIVTAVGADGKTVQPTNATWNEIQSVKSPATGATQLITARGGVSPADVLQLS
ncbi:MAG TPA: flagellar hook capping FlgD N-terminal domain-containing protein [Sphingomonas sp.]|nr:flagellar hook capping FlgD N-terminal domain-containing protein [Sphingomonas sp.]